MPIPRAEESGGILDSGFQKMIDESDIFMANEEFPFSSRGNGGGG